MVSTRIRAKDVKVHDGVKAHIDSAIESFKKFGLEITSVNVNIAKEKKGVSVEFDIHIAHATPVVISQSDEDLDTAIDLAIDRASKALRRLHTKVASHKGETSVKDLELIEE
jgi:putative sigma-54 modulation protein